jgi:uncharacterized protein
MHLGYQVLTFGQWLLNKYGERVHKLALNVGFTCPNRDGSKGIGGCTFCNNVSFNPQGRVALSVSEQIERGRKVIKKRTGATKYIAYFQAYTNTYDDIERLKVLYDQALAEPDVIGLSIGTRPDCVPQDVLNLLNDYRQQGYEIWLELGLQSAFDNTLKAINRGHGFAEYADTLKRARAMGLPVCTHLIIGLPGEHQDHYNESLDRVLDLGVDGLKFHPLHVVKGTALANSWRNGEYQAITMEHYVDSVLQLIAKTPKQIIFHRLTGTAESKLLLAPHWCDQKWSVLNAISEQLPQTT